MKPAFDNCNNFEKMLLEIPTNVLEENADTLYAIIAEIQKSFPEKTLTATIKTAKEFLLWQLPRI